MGFRCFLGRYLFQLIVLLKPDPNCLSSYVLSWVDKATTGTKSFVSVILKSGTWFAAVPATRIQSLVLFNWRTMSQLIKDISSVLQRLHIYFYGTIILTSLFS